MIVFFDEVGMEQQIEHLAEVLDTECERDCQEYIIKLPSNLGKGQITGFAFDYGIGLLLLNGFLKENLKLVYKSGVKQAVQFHFCLGGDFRHSLNDESIAYQLNPLMGSISTNPCHCAQSLHFPKGVQIRHANLQVLRSEYLLKVDCDIDRMPPKLGKVFSDVEGITPFLYESNYSVPTAECIKQIMESNHQGLVRSAYTEAKTLELLSLQLKQFQDDSDPSYRFTNLKRYDLDRILAAKEILVEDLQNAPTIVQLAKQSGINQQKLKKGFKEVFKKTINQYLRDVRLEAAKFLLMEGKSSVRDIAQQVGYSNPSHFARRFNDKYGMLPKDVQRINKLL